MDQQTFSSTLPPPKANLFTLPLEIRNEIYRHLLSTRLTRVDLGLGHARYDIQPAILATKRQIHDEGTAILSENKFISIITSWTSFKQDLLVQGKFPTIAERQSDDNVLLPVPHMFTALNSSAVDYDPKVCYEYLTCLDDLPYLCRLLFYTSCQIVDFNRSLHLTLAIQHPPGRSDEAVSKKLQEDLMMPFAVLKGLGSLTVTGAKNNAVEKELRKAMKTPNPTAGEYLESAAKLKDAGDVAFKAGDYTGSIKIYIQAYEAMIFIVEGKRFAVMLDYYFASKILIEGRFSGQRGDLGERAISDIEHKNVQQEVFDGSPNLVTTAEKAKVYWRMAVASKALDKRQVWVRSLMMAHKFAPYNVAIKRECEALEKRLEAGDFDF